MGKPAREVEEKVSGLDVTLAAVLVDRFKANAARVRELAFALTNEQFWQKTFPFGNSFGHLVLHLTGNSLWSCSVRRICNITSAK